MSEEFKSISWIDRVPAGGLVFETNLMYDLMTSDSRRIIKNIVTNFPNKEALNPIPVCHVTYKNGSERNLYTYFANHGDAVLLVEISHSYIDHHFIYFMLWETDDSTQHKYHLGESFIEEFLYESPENSDKIGELFIRPTAITIHTIKFDLSNLLPDGNEIKELEIKVNNCHPFQFWTKFKAKDYNGAGDSLKDLLSSLYLEKSTKENEDFLSFINSLYAVCKYQAKEFESAGKLFLLTGKDYLRTGLKRNADLCFFFALEAGKGINDINKSFEIASEVVGCFRFFENDIKNEVLGIIKTYYASIYMGTAILCRRLIEIYVSEKLERTFKLPIKKQINNAKEKGEIYKGIGPGIFGILELAKLKGIINKEEYTLASNIKDFGNSINKQGSIENLIDAKYALFSCIYFIHRGE
jgi:hypothetical protein